MIYFRRLIHYLSLGAGIMPHCEIVHYSQRTCILITARLAQSAERKALNLVVVGSSPMVGAFAKRWRSARRANSAAI